MFQDGEFAIHLVYEKELHLVLRIGVLGRLKGFGKFCPSFVSDDALQVVKIDALGRYVCHHVKKLCDVPICILT